MSIFKLFSSDNYLVVNKELIKILGLDEAILFAELCSEYCNWEEQGKLDDGLFYSTVETIKENTTLSKYQQSNALKVLESIGLVATELKGIPAKRYFRLYEENFVNLLTTSSQKTELQGVKKLYSNISNNTNISNNINNINNQEYLIEEDIKDKKTTTMSTSVEKFVSDYNSICKSLPKCTKITNKRKRSILKILKAYAEDEILQVFNNLEGSEFCKGNNDNGWKANIDFILREDKFVATLEGKYGTRKSARAGRTVETTSLHGEQSVVVSKEEKEELRRLVESGELEEY